jgi:hypothetical protein
VSNAEAVLDLIADLVAVKLRQRAVPAQEGVYTSLCLPPDVPSRERFNRLVKAVPGAQKRGRIWVVQKTAWEAARGSKKVLVQDLADKVLAKAGYRRAV